MSCESDPGHRALVSIDNHGVHFVVEVGGRLILMGNGDTIVMLQ
jgi:hypothetical protein